MSDDVLSPATGAIPSRQDYRDDYVSAAILKDAVELPEEFDTDLTVLGPVMMQAQTPSCVSHSVALELKKHWYKKTGKVVNFSPRFLDILVKRFDGLSEYRASAGTYPRMVFRLAVKYGCATTDVLPNDTLLSTLEYRDDELLTDSVMEDAEKYRLPGYVRIGDDALSTRKAIMEYGSVSQLLRIGEEWWTPSWRSSDIEPLRPPKVVVSGHQVNPKGWNDLETGIATNRLRNSWSDRWATKGEAMYRVGDWSPQIFETWAVAEIPENVKLFLETLPAPDKFHFDFRRSMRVGDYSDDVKWVQIAFMILGLLEMVPVDQLGYFGPKTMKANLAFQRLIGIKQTSAEHIGPRTLNGLNKQFQI